MFLYERWWGLQEEEYEDGGEDVFYGLFLDGLCLQQPTAQTKGHGGGGAETQKLLLLLPLFRSTNNPSSSSHTHVLQQHGKSTTVHAAASRRPSHA